MMSLVDRWLVRPLARADAATFATSATSRIKTGISAGRDVATQQRHVATSDPPTIETPLVSQPVAFALRQEELRNSSRAEAMSQMSQMSQAATRAAWSDIEEERASVVEHDGNIPLAWAEGFARLNPDRPPADVPPVRWRRFVDDVGLFLDSPFCAVAAALGWGPYELFGCDRDRPFARIDLCGLLWLLNGQRLVMLAADAATIEMTTGARQIWRRKSNRPGEVIAWELETATRRLA